MIEMKIKSLKDQSLNTSCGKYMLVEGEVKVVTFKDMTEFKAYLGFDVFMPVPDGTPESKSIPVVLPVPMKDGLPLALHDGENELPLSNDPEEPNEVTVAALEEKEEDLHEVESVEELMEELEADDPVEEDKVEEDDDEEDLSSWTGQIDRV